MQPFKTAMILINWNCKFLGNKPVSNGLWILNEFLIYTLLLLIWWNTDYLVKFYFRCMYCFVGVVLDYILTWCCISVPEQFSLIVFQGCIAAIFAVLCWRYVIHFLNITVFNEYRTLQKNVNRYFAFDV